MSGSAVVALGDAVVMVALWALVVAKRVPRIARLPLALMSFGCAWMLCFMSTRSHLAKWTWLGGIVAILISLTLLIVAAQLSLPSDSGGGEDGEGGLPRRAPDPPTDGGDPAEPSWWPEFEHDLARYSAERDRREREVLTRR